MLLIMNYDDVIDYNVSALMCRIEYNQKIQYRYTGISLIHTNFVSNRIDDRFHVSDFENSLTVQS